MIQPAPANQQNSTAQRTVLLATDFKNTIHAEIHANNPNRMAYSPYGWQSTPLEFMTGLGFNGELREMESQWYVLGKGYRVYNPRLMRFHSTDSLSPFQLDQWNAYAYCGGEPVRRSDPTGHYFGWLSWGAQKVIGGLRTITTRTAGIATTAVNQTASAVSSGLSGISKTGHIARQAVTKAFTFNPEFPVPIKAHRDTFSGTPPLHRSNFWGSDGYANRTLGRKKIQKPQAHEYINRNAIGKDIPRPQPHGYANKVLLDDKLPPPQKHGYSNRREFTSEATIMKNMAKIRS